MCPAPLNLKSYKRKTLHGRINLRSHFTPETESGASRFVTAEQYRTKHAAQAKEYSDNPYFVELYGYDGRVMPKKSKVKHLKR